MKLLMIILKDESLLEVVASILVEEGLYRTAVIDGENIESLVGEGIPLFTSFKSLFGDQGAYNRTIFCPIEQQKVLEDLLAVFAQEGIDFSSEEVGSLLTIPCTLFNGKNGDAL